ncbi:MAG: hypothetical protein Q9218_007376 [Villophora microphyllina]
MFETSLLNGSALRAPVDPRFSIGLRTDYVKLPENSYKIGALLLLASLAQLDWESSIPTTIAPISPRWRGVAVFGGAVASVGELPVKFLVWGIYMAMVVSIRAREYQQSIFDLFWDSRKVGELHFQKIPTLLASPHTNRTALLRSLNLPASLSTLSDTALSELEVQPVNVIPTFIPGARDLDLDKFWLLSLNALTDMASIGSKKRMNDRFTWKPVHTEMQLSFSAREGPGLPRSTPPFLTFGTMARAITGLAEWMLPRAGANKEMEFQVEFGSSRTTVGTGSVEYQSRLPSTSL